MITTLVFKKLHIITSVIKILHATHLDLYSVSRYSDYSFSFIDIFPLAHRFFAFSTLRFVFSPADINECLTDNGGCEDACTNTEGSRQCSCTNGDLNIDGTSCTGEYATYYK